jgi:hypothetical protein
MDASTWAAWWGAGSGTLAVAWEIFSWLRSGPRLRVTASPNMQYITPGVGFDDTVYIHVNVTNVGDQPTTITHFFGQTYRSRLDRLRNKREKAFVVNTGTESPIPHKIDVGETWYAMAPQLPAEEIASNSLLYLGVQCASHKKPRLVRVRLKE